MGRRITTERGLEMTKRPHWDVTVGGVKIARGNVQMLVITSKSKEEDSDVMSVQLVTRHQAYCATPADSDWAEVRKFTNDFLLNKEITTRTEKIGRTTYSVLTARRPRSFLRGAGDQP